MIMLNIISNLHNRLVIVRSDYSEIQLKEFIINTLINDGLDGRGLSIPPSKIDMEHIPTSIVTLNIVIYYDDDRDIIGEYILSMRDENFCNGYSLPRSYVVRQVDKYWDIIRHFIAENLN